MSERIQKLNELAGLIDPVYAIVELGVNFGESLVALALGSKGAPVYGIDLWGWDTDVRGEKHRRRRGFQTDDARAGAARRLENAGVKACLIQGSTHDIAKAWSRPIGLLYIDAAHDVVSVSHDYEDWARHVVPGGWIAFDDAEPGEKVNKVIKSIVNASGCWDNWGRADVNGRLAFAQRNTNDDPMLKPAAKCGGDYDLW